MPSECETCKPGNPTFHASAVENTGCEASYQLVDECMKKHGGRVSACTEQWALFRQCHATSKAAKAQQERDR